LGRSKEKQALRSKVLSSLQNLLEEGPVHEQHLEDCLERREIRKERAKPWHSRGGEVAEKKVSVRCRFEARNGGGRQRKL